MNVSGAESAEGTGEKGEKKEILDYQIILDYTFEIVRSMETAGWCV